MREHEEELRSIVSKVIKIKKEAIGLQDDLVQMYSMDSMQRVEVTIEMEKAFDVTISDEVAATLRTLQQLLDYLEECVKQKS